MPMFHVTTEEYHTVTYLIEAATPQAAFEHVADNLDDCKEAIVSDEIDGIGNEHIVEPVDHSSPPQTFLYDGE